MQADPLFLLLVPSGFFDDPAQDGFLRKGGGDDFIFGEILQGLVDLADLTFLLLQGFSRQILDGREEVGGESQALLFPSLSQCRGSIGNRVAA